MNEDVNLEIALKDLASIYKWIYFQSMLLEKDQTVEGLKTTQHRFLDRVIDKIHNKYADHIDGLKKEETFEFSRKKLMDGRDLL